MSEFLNKLWHRIKIRGLGIVISCATIMWSVVILISKFLNGLWHRIKTGGEDIGLPFIIIGFSIVILLFSLTLADVPIEVTLFSTVLSLGLALISVGLGFTSLGMSAKSDKRQIDLLERLDKNVAELPLLFKGDILTPSGHRVIKELLGGRSKEAAQKRLDEDYRRVGYVRGELFQNNDGSWSIHWGGKYPL